MLAARAAGSLLLCALAAGCAAEPPAPNVLLVTIDTLRADHLSSYGFSLPSSPEIDRLAAQGALFERAIAASSTTGPSHASIMTSRYTREHSIGPLTGETQLVGGVALAEAFRGAGYATAAFVGNVNLRRRSGFDRGFDVYDDELPDVERNRPGTFERIAEVTTRRALAWLASQPRRPVFLWVHYQDPHGPYAPPPEHVGRFHLAPAPGEQPLPVRSDNAGLGGIPRYQALEGLSLASEYRGRYADEIFYADLWFGKLLGAVDADPSGRPAVVLLTADHGESMGEEGAWFVHFRPSTPAHAHVPLILRAPGIPPGRRAGPVSHVDVLPTLLELAGLPVPPGTSGIALGPYLREGRPLPDRLVYCDSGFELSAYRGGSFVRAGELQEAWNDERAGELVPKWSAYRWDPSGAWARIADAGAERARVGRDREQIAAYYAAVVPMQPAPPPDPEDVERLRALGYAE